MFSLCYHRLFMCISTFFTCAYGGAAASSSGRGLRSPRLADSAAISRFFTQTGWLMHSKRVFTDGPRRPAPACLGFTVLILCVAYRSLARRHLHHEYSQANMYPPLYCPCLIELDYHLGSYRCCEHVLLGFVLEKKFCKVREPPVEHELKKRYCMVL